MIVIALIVVAALVLMTVFGAARLDGQNELRHPPDDNGCTKDDVNEY